jgi:hypothetical protein
VKGAKLAEWTKLFNEAKSKAAKGPSSDDSKDEEKDDEEENDDDDEDDGKKKKKSKAKAKAKSKGKSKGGKGGPLSSWYGTTFNTDSLAKIYGAWTHHYILPITRS